MRDRLAPAAALAALAAGPASAHEVVPGVGGFAGLMLHPLFVTEHLLCLLAACIVAGRAGRGALPAAIAAHLAGFAAGKGVEMAWPAIVGFWRAPLVVSLAAGLCVAALPRFPRRLALAAVFVLGGLVSMGVTPEATGRPALLAAVGAAAATGAVLLLAAGWTIARVERRFGATAGRIAGAWISAVAFMGLALTFRPL